MDYFIIVVTTVAGLAFHAWLIIRIRRWGVGIWLCPLPAATQIGAAGCYNVSLKRKRRE